MDGDNSFLSELGVGNPLAGQLQPQPAPPAAKPYPGLSGYFSPRAPATPQAGTAPTPAPAAPAAAAPAAPQAQDVPEPPGPATQAPETTPGAYQAQGGVGPTRMPDYQALPLIQQTEDASGDPAAMNFVNDPTHTAGGYYQITDTNWKKYAQQVGIDTNIYPTAVSTAINGPTEAKRLQGLVASAMYKEQGFAPWAPYNPALRKLINWQGEVRDPVTGALVDPTQAGQPGQPGQNRMGGMGGIMAEFNRLDANTIAALQQMTGLQGEALHDLILTSGSTLTEAIANIKQSILEQKGSAALYDANRQKQADTQWEASKQLWSDDKKLLDWAQKQPTRQAAYANVMHLTPLLSILAAIGGKATGVSATAMLGATAGIIQGVNAGAENQFHDAVDKWQAQYDALKDHMNNMQEVYKQMYDAYGTRADAADKAIEHTRNILGDQLMESQMKMGNAATIFNAQMQVYNQIGTNALAFQKIKEAALGRAMTNMGMFDPRIMQITAEMASQGVRFPPGFSKNTQQMALEGFIMNHPQMSDADIAHAIGTGQYQREMFNNIARRVGVRAAAIAMSSRQLIRPNGSFDKLDRAAWEFQQEAGNWPTQQLREQIVGALSRYNLFHPLIGSKDWGTYTDPKLQAYITYLMETRQELSRSLQGGGQAVTEADARANAELPELKGYDALHAGIMASYDMVKNAAAGVQEIIEGIGSGKPFGDIRQEMGAPDLPVAPTGTWVPPSTLLREGAEPFAGIYGAQPGYTAPSQGSSSDWGAPSLAPPPQIGGGAAGAGPPSVSGW